MAALQELANELLVGYPILRSRQSSHRIKCRSPSISKWVEGMPIRYGSGALLASMVAKECGAILDSADARIGRPLTPLSVAGVHRRAYRRAHRSAVYGGAAAYGVGSYYGYGYPASSGSTTPATTHHRRTLAITHRSRTTATTGGLISASGGAIEQLGGRSLTSMPDRRSLAIGPIVTAARASRRSRWSTSMCTPADRRWLGSSEHRGGGSS